MDLVVGVFIPYIFSLLFTRANFLQFIPEYLDGCSRTTTEGYQAAFVHDKSIGLWSGIRFICAHIILYYLIFRINQIWKREVCPPGKFHSLRRLA